MTAGEQRRRGNRVVWRADEPMTTGRPSSGLADTGSDGPPQASRANGGPYLGSRGSVDSQKTVRQRRKLDRNGSPNRSAWFAQFAAKARLPRHSGVADHRAENVTYVTSTSTSRRNVEEPYFHSSQWRRSGRNPVELIWYLQSRDRATLGRVNQSHRGYRVLNGESSIPVPLG
jgi:hypothetical protein